MVEAGFEPVKEVRGRLLEAVAIGSVAVARELAREVPPYQLDQV